jgi:hypothetical protein
MSMVQVAPPYPIFTDVDGSPLDGGQVFLGFVNQNPETNPIEVYWDQELTLPAAQPIKTSGGYPVRGGTPAMIYTDGTFSIAVRNKRGKLVYSSPVGYAVQASSVAASLPIAAVSENLTSINNVAAGLADVNRYAAEYIGTRSTPPATRADGSALQLGDSYWDSASHARKFFDGGVWYGPPASGAVTTSALVAHGSVTASTIFDETVHAVQWGKVGGDVVENLAGISPSAGSPVFLAKSFWIGGSQGGGKFFWSASQAKNTHNGVTIISPTVPSISAQGLNAWLNGTGETAPAGTGCWMRQNTDTVRPEWAGAKADGSDEFVPVQKALSAASGKVLKLAATYVLGASMTVPASGITFASDNFGGFLRKANTNTLLLDTAGATYIKSIGVRWDGNLANQTPLAAGWAGVRVVSAGRFHSQGSEYIGFDRYPLRIEDTSNVTVLGGKITDGGGGSGSGNSSTSCYITTTGTVIEKIRVIGVDFSRDTDHWWPQLQVRPDVVLSGSVILDVIFSKNTFRCSTNTQHVNACCMEILGAQRAIFSNNTANGKYAITISSVNSGYVSATGNSLTVGCPNSSVRDGFDHKGIEITGCATSIVSSNAIDGAGYLRSGIRVNSSNYLISVNSNVFANPGNNFRGVEFGNSGNCSASGNDIDGNLKTGVIYYAQSCTKVDISGGIVGNINGAGSKMFWGSDLDTVCLRFTGSILTGVSGSYDSAILITNAQNVTLDCALSYINCPGSFALWLEGSGVRGLQNLRLSGSVNGVFSSAALLKSVDTASVNGLTATGTYSYGLSLQGSDSAQCKRITAKSNNFRQATGQPVLLTGSTSNFSDIQIETEYSAALAGGIGMVGMTVVNTSPTESGSVGSKYVIDKWRVVTSGSPGTWMQLRSLTGN